MSQGVGGVFLKSGVGLEGVKESKVLVFVRADIGFVSGHIERWLPQLFVTALRYRHFGENFIEYGDDAGASA